VSEFLRRNPLIAGLAVLCVALAAIVVVELVAIGRATPTVPPRKAVPAEVKLLPQIAATSPESAYTETGARPLWIPTRRPAPPVAVAAAQTFTRGQFILQGVTIAGSTRIAMLKEKASGRIHRVELGRDVNGLHLAEIEPDRVTLSQGGEREVVELRVQRLAGPGPAPGAGGAPAPPAASAGVSGPFVSFPTSPPPVSPAPGGVPLIPPGPMPPSARPPAAPTTPATTNPAPGTVPQQSAAPMTPEELLARRRARRNQPTE
jgi:hypothetical protein